MIALLAAAAMSARLVRDDVAYRVVLDPRLAHPLEVWRGDRRIAACLLRRYRPWKLAIAQALPDGRQEIAVGVRKPTHNLRFPHTTLFLIAFDGRELKRFWTASTMGRPLRDFAFGPARPGAHQLLATLETTPSGATALSTYVWRSFGYKKRPGERVWPSAAHLRSAGNRLLLNAGGRRVALDWNRL